MALAALVLVVPAEADTGPLPGSCKLHHNKVLNPGCIPALTEGVDGAVGNALVTERTYPNLVPDVTEVIVFRPPTFNPETGGWDEGEPDFLFDTYSQNQGTVPLDLLADDPTDLGGSTVSQCVAWSPPYACRERAPVGGFTWHEEHTHFHYEDFAFYEFRRLDASGQPDFSPAGLVASSEKVSFCLIDSQWMEMDKVSPPSYLTCNPARQGISPGWADIYTSDLPGQQMELDGIRDGRYALIISMNTAGTVFETTHADNRLIVTLEFTDDMHAVQIVGRSWS